MTATAGAPVCSRPRERPAERGIDAEDVEEARGHARARQLLRPIAVGRVEPVVGDRRETARASSRASASSTNDGYENGPSAIARFGFDPDSMNRRAAVLERQRPQQRRVDDAEDGGVRADADRDDRDGDERELARLQAAIESRIACSGRSHHVPLARRDAGSEKRPAANGVRSNCGSRPVITSARMRPAAGECWKPWPLKPLMRKSPSTPSAAPRSDCRPATSRRARPTRARSTRRPAPAAA